MSVNEKKRLSQLQAMFGDGPQAKQQKLNSKKISHAEFDLKTELESLDQAAKKLKSESVVKHTTERHQKIAFEWGLELMRPRFQWWT